MEESNSECKVVFCKINTNNNYGYLEISQGEFEMNDANSAALSTRQQSLQLNTIGVSELLEILPAGFRDFRAAPTFGLFFSGIYTVGGWVLILLLLYFEMSYLVYPLAAGFALIASFIACVFYIVSKRLEDEQPLSWGQFLVK
jgi:uncharacterized membrane protein